MKHTNQPIYKEIRCARPDKIRAMCAKYGFYLRATNIEYESFISYYATKENLTTNDIFAMAIDISSHSFIFDTQMSLLMQIIESECCYTVFEEI